MSLVDVPVLIVLDTTLRNLAIVLSYLFFLFFLLALGGLSLT